MHVPYVERNRRTEPARRRTPVRAGDAPEFAGCLHSLPAAGAEAPSEPLAACGLDALLGAQELQVDTEHDRRRAAVRHGSDLLDELDALRLRLLGDPSPATLAALTRRLGAHRQRCGEPELEALIDDIELRARVEMAKLGIGA